MWDWKRPFMVSFFLSSNSIESRASFPDNCFTRDISAIERLLYHLTYVFPVLNPYHVKVYELLQGCCDGPGLIPLGPVERCLGDAGEFGDLSLGQPCPLAQCS